MFPGIWRKLAFKLKDVFYIMGFLRMESWDPSNGFLGMLKRWNAKITMYKLGFFCNAVWESRHQKDMTQEFYPDPRFHQLHIF